MTNAITPPWWGTRSLGPLVPSGPSGGSLAAASGRPPTAPSRHWAGDDDDLEPQPADTIDGFAGGPGHGAVQISLSHSQHPL